MSTERLLLAYKLFTTATFCEASFDAVRNAAAPRNPVEIKLERKSPKSFTKTASVDD